jgi:hypothetical protein
MNDLALKEWYSLEVSRGGGGYIPLHRFANGPFLQFWSRSESVPSWVCALVVSGFAVVSALKIAFQMKHVD